MNKKSIAIFNKNIFAVRHRVREICGKDYEELPHISDRYKLYMKTLKLPQQQRTRL